MTKTKLFTTFFDQELKSRGFKRKAKLYYRLNGEILQGIVFKDTNPYDIHFYSAPYWMKNIQAKLHPLHKGYWAEYGWCISPGTTAYYREENEQLNYDYMNICFNLAKDHILPILDEINDLNSYIDNCVPNWKSVDEDERRMDVIRILPREINERYSYIDAPITMLWRIWDELYTYHAFLYYGYVNNDLKGGYNLLEKQATFLPFHTNRNRYAQSKYAEYLTDDGLKRAEQYFEERRKIMLPRLRNELELDTFGL